MDPVTTIMSSTNIRISWNLPNVSNGADIDGYRVLILEKDHFTFSEFPTLCNGSQSIVISTRRCDIPMSNIT